MHICRIAVLAGVVPALAAACAASPNGPEFTPKDAGDIRQDTQTLVKAFNAKDVPAIVKLFSENSTVMPPNEPTVRGPVALNGFYDDFFKQGATNLRLEITEISGHGPIAYESGTYEMEFGSGSASHDRGKFLFILRNMGGHWRYEYAVWNSDLPTDKG